MVNRLVKLRMRLKIVIIDDTEDEREVHLLDWEMRGLKTKLDIIVLETHFVGGVDEGGNLVGGNCREKSDRRHVFRDAPSEVPETSTHGPWSISVER